MAYLNLGYTHGAALIGSVGSLLLLLLLLAVALSVLSFPPRRTEVSILARLLEERHPATLRHGERTAEISLRIAEALGISFEADTLGFAATIHDLGKVYVPSEILDKPGPLTYSEYEEVKAHASLGANLLRERGLEKLALLVECHHERVDGTGYPNALAGDSIPAGSRIISVADAYDAMRSGGDGADRPYRAPLTHRRAVDELRQCAGTQFDPIVVAAFCEVYDWE
jgi:HD-GYP domain-containing protein (c-di-GMP phosphodiesterase class II)